MTKFTHPLQDHAGYSAGHPWYYLLGGDIPSLKQIQADAIASGYCGYNVDELRATDKRAEPKRSEALRIWQVKFRADLTDDISRYREIVCDLRQFRELNPVVKNAVSCEEVHTSMSLKYAHLYNDFAHLNLLDEMLSKQLDLFG